ncbi:ArnT family glycosyltransferase [Amycolatopsis suaedae]|uniref:Glycosyltransferase family 39 protein n=1 Tax=Amycolatopsis suaedae TaxID=2510978 RepID=A0A4Q7IXT2_9PSEU|nr:glycosyltransferase family 39 protein [Amycolatopsis suaedae]RZQ59760.1 glycosyltransferase family 39 protein [Amycolatopsis suaedae]
MTAARFAAGPVLSVAGLAGLALLLTSGRYGYGFDEMYFLVAGRDHPAWGYFDQPPLVPALAAAMDWLFPGSLVALRLPVTLAFAGGVVVTGLIARELGGGRGAQLMAAGLYATSSLLTLSHWLATYTLDPFFWTVVAWLLVRWNRTRRHGTLVLAGVVTAVSLQTKFLIPAFWVAVLAAAAVFGPRELLRQRGLWTGAAIAALVTVPALVWQAAHGWPYLAMSEVVAAEFPGHWAFLRDVVLGAGIGVGVPALLYGTWRLLRDPALRFLGVALLVLVVAFLVAQGRSNYLLGMFAVPFAVAAVEIAKRDLARWWRAAAWPAFVLSAVVALASLPVYPRSALDRVPPTWGPFVLGSAMAGGELPQQELGRMVAATWAALPGRDRTAVFAEIYPFAAAVDVYGRDQGVARAYSGHRGYWFFGAPPESADAVLFVGFDPALLRPYFAGQTPVAEGLMWLYEGRRRPWAEIWPQLRRR